MTELAIWVYNIYSLHLESLSSKTQKLASAGEYVEQTGPFHGGGGGGGNVNEYSY